MKKELTYFNIEESYGWNQKWFKDPTMKLGGCAAVVCCDLCIYLKMTKEYKHLYPYEITSVQRKDYIKFSKTMKKYLKPRLTGINTLDLYIDGFRRYLDSINDKEIELKAFSGDNNIECAKEIVIKQIDKDMPIPYLLLIHKNKEMKELVWHWFLIVGYEKIDNELFVKIVTYGKYKWISFNKLYDTRHYKKGGMIIIN